MHKCLHSPFALALWPRNYTLFPYFYRVDDDDGGDQEDEINSNQVEQHPNHAPTSQSTIAVNPEISAQRGDINSSLNSRQATATTRTFQILPVGQPILNRIRPVRDLGGGGNCLLKHPVISFVDKHCTAK